MELGKALELMREQKGIKATALAKTIGMSKSAVCRYESGEITPSLDALGKIATALGTKVCEIIAKAEGVTLEQRHETPAQSQARQILESLDQRDLSKIAAIAEIIKRDTK